MDATAEAHGGAESAVFGNVAWAEVDGVDATAVTRGAESAVFGNVA